MDYFTIYEKILMRGKARTKVSGDFLHKHRIIPGHEGGTYDEDNISFLTRKEHRIVHKLRYILYGRTADKIACSWLSSKLSDDEINELKRQGAIKGGKKTGAFIRDNKIGIFSRSKEQMSQDGQKASKARHDKWKERNKDKLREKAERDKFFTKLKSVTPSSEGKMFFPPNKSTSYCIGCHKEVQPSRLLRAHRNCFKEFQARSCRPT